MPLGSAFNIPGSSENDVKSDINVTPLVDVCLVMLIIFMVVTPLLRAGADVNLPQTNLPPKMPEGSKQKTISMTARAEVVIDGVWIPDQNLKAYFKDLFTQSPEKTLVIKADKAPEVQGSPSHHADRQRGRVRRRRAGDGQARETGG